MLCTVLHDTAWLVSLCGFSTVRLNMICCEFVNSVAWHFFFSFFQIQSWGSVFGAPLVPSRGRSAHGDTTMTTYFFHCSAHAAH